MIIRVRPSKDVLATGTGTRRRTFTVAGRPHTIEFSKEPIYLEVDAIPTELAQDPHLLTREVTQEEMLAAHGSLTVLAAELQDDPPSAIIAAAVVEPGSDTGEGLDLKAERVQEPAAAVVEPGVDTGEGLDLKAERVQKPAATVANPRVETAARGKKK